MKQKLINRVLIIAPVSVLPSWKRELDEHLKPFIKNIDIELINSDVPKKKREQILTSIFHQPYIFENYSPKIIISSYQLVSNMIDSFSNQGKWDYVILDEGHIIKNPATQTSKNMGFLQSLNRLILTGIPICILCI